MPIKLISGAGGSLTVQPASTASNYTLTVPAVTANVVTTGDSNTITQTMVNQSSFFAGYGPAFSVTKNANQTIGNSSWTKLSFQLKEFDTASCFDNSTNYRFTPNVAGYYQINGSAYMGGLTGQRLSIYKNGANYKHGFINGSGAYVTSTTVSALVYLNGSTDYIELYIYQSSGGNGTVDADTSVTYFQGSLMRAG